VHGKMFGIFNSEVFGSVLCTSVFLTEEEYRYLIPLHIFAANKVVYKVHYILSCQKLTLVLNCYLQQKMTGS
jgi:hypothetical protein